MGSCLFQRDKKALDCPARELSLVVSAYDIELLEIAKTRTTVAEAWRAFNAGKEARVSDLP